MPTKQEFRTGEVGLSSVGWSKSWQGAPGVQRAPLQGDVFADVAVVGGGLMGCSLALQLAERNVSVALVERREIGFGASGRNGGSVATHAEGTRLPMQAIRALPDAGQRYLGLVAGGPAAVQETVARHAIDCNFTPSGHLSVGIEPGHLARLTRDAEMLSELGIAVEMLDRDQTQELTGSERFAFALRQPGGGTINSLAYTNGLAAAAERAGAKVYIHSTAQAFRRAKSRWQVQTESGSLLVDKIVFCIGAYGQSALGAFSQAYFPFLLSAINLKPLREELRQRVLPGNASIYQVGIPAAILKDPTGRVTLSSGAPPLNPGSATMLSQVLLPWLAATFPDLRASDLAVEHYWTGLEAFTLDQLPRLYDVAPGVLAVMGFNGLGITSCTQFGRVVGGFLIDEDVQGLPIPLARPTRYFGRGMFRIAASATIAAALWRARPHSAPA